jgi:hypothetical protein
MSTNEIITKLGEMGTQYVGSKTNTLHFFTEAAVRMGEQDDELLRIDAILARRPALANFNSRTEKIEHAINTAKRVDDLELIFLHSHVSNGKDDRCYKCGLDLRDTIHKRIDMKP